MVFEIDSEYKVIDIEKTICKSDIYNNNVTCLKDTVLFIIYPLYGNFSLINEYFLEDQNYQVDLPLFYSLSIINNNNNYMKWKINNIMLLKILKLFLFYIICSISFILIYLILVQYFYEKKYDIINQITDIMEDGQFFETKDKNDIIQRLASIEIEPNNKDMVEVKNIFENIVKTMLLKFNFEEKNLSFYTNSNKNRNKKRIKNKKYSNLDNLNEYMDLIKKLSNPETKIMSIFIITYEHFKKGYFKLAEN